MRKYSELTHEEIASQFFAKHGIDPETMTYLGKGVNGVAYSVPGQKVLKLTTSRTEYEAALQLLEKPANNLVRIYDAVPASDKPRPRFYILMEELDTDPEDEYLFLEVLSLLETQGLPVTYLGYFDTEEYEALHGEIPHNVKTYMEELYGVVQDATRLVGDRADIHGDNLGRNSAGTLKGFDLDERQ